MSWKRRRKAKSTVDDPPMLVERLQKQEHAEDGPRLSYEEANWARLSPVFRATHNRLRQTRGLPTIPPPKIDLYVPPKAPLIRTFDPADKEFVKATREFLGATLMGGGTEGFTINGKKVNL